MGKKGHPLMKTLIFLLTTYREETAQTLSIPIK